MSTLNGYSESNGATTRAARTAEQPARVTATRARQGIPPRRLAAGAAGCGTAHCGDARYGADAGGDGPLERLRGVGLGYVTFATEHPSHFRVMFGREMADRSAFPALRQIATETFNVVVDAISDCQRAGLVRSEEPPADLALTAWSSVHGLSALLANGVLDKPVADVAELVTRDLFLGLGRRR